jgi:hypothetical protein
MLYNLLVVLDMEEWDTVEWDMEAADMEEWDTMEWDTEGVDMEESEV